MSDKHSPAFPTITWDQLPSGQFAQVTENIGLTKLEFFACNAPNEIPGWFTYIKPEKNIAEAPNFNDIENKEDRELCRQWLHDPIFDLPEYLQWFADKSNDAANQYSEWIKKDNAARYFQWRRYYAEQLLLTLSTPQP